MVCLANGSVCLLKPKNSRKATSLICLYNLCSFAFNRTVVVAPLRSCLVTNAGTGCCGISGCVSSCGDISCLTKTSSFCPASETARACLNNDELNTTKVRVRLAFYIVLVHLHRVHTFRKALFQTNSPGGH